ncbi:conserved hypothetical protein [Nitrosococcus halophilus Nc 4]|uniref:Polymerase nucleotidyl transferase domain-containing protein n=1 Tax=Nitrosococcus halophilus (strain Nc4) TaxID=472759 RepID=D5C3J8_NITHN|nr:hypothetical protein [Nitrosococcus halophilus]ADE16905.1 conserved hypothetical protein [Nitrosococcus halophilus Nc 4]
MSKKDQQMREYIATEAARLMVEHGIKSYYQAKRKAATVLGAADTRNLPTNQEIEQAVGAYLRLFKSDSQPATLEKLRQIALEAMDFFHRFNPHLVGPVLSGLASEHSDINLHLFAETEEEVALFLTEAGIPFQLKSRQLSFSPKMLQSLPVFRFVAGEVTVELTVFPPRGIRHAPLSPIDGKPMCRADRKEVQSLLEAETPL